MKINNSEGAQVDEMGRNVQAKNRIFHLADLK
jgi:hypothetical protein